MLVKATRNMATEIRKNAPADYCVEYLTMTPDQFGWYVDYDVYRNETDYNPRTGKFSVIRISYPAEFYAMPKYLTTRELLRIYRNAPKDYDGFFCEVVHEIAI